MFHQHSIAGRISIGIVSGFVIGLLVMVGLPLAGLESFTLFGFGTLLIFVLMGVLTGFLGIFSRHPLFAFRMPWWLRGLMVGFVVTLTYTLLSYETLMVVMQSPLLSWTGLTSPFWVLLDGMAFALLISAIETWFAGEGEGLPRT